MADSPAPSPDGSYGTYPSSRDSTPQPGITNCGFVPIDLPNGNQQLGSAQIAMSDPNIGHPRCQGQPEIGEYSRTTTTTSGGTRFNMADANISAPQIKWSTGSDGMSFTFTGVSNSGTMTSTSECSYASSTDDFDDQRSGCSETSKSKAKPKRKRIITKDQRRAANQRERRRMVTLNDAFDMLKQRIPTFTHEKKLSRIETLRLAISYISFMGQLVDGKHPSDVTINLPYPKSDDDQQGHGNLSDVMENYGYVMHDSMAPEPMVAMDTNGYVMDMNQQHHQQGYYSNGGFMTQ